MDLAAVRAGLAEVLQEALPVWRVEDYIPDAPNPPCLLVGFPDELNAKATLSGRSKLALPVIVVLGAADMRSAQRSMDAALSTGEGSVLKVLQGATHPAWFGPVMVQGVRNVGRAVTVGGAQLFAANIDIELLA